MLQIVTCEVSLTIGLFPVLRQYMRRNDVSWKELAMIANMGCFAFHMKMWGIWRWKMTDAVKICCFFNAPDAGHLFVRKHSKSQFSESQGESYHV